MAMNRWQKFTDEELRALEAGIEDLVAKFPKPVATALLREISGELARRSEPQVSRWAARGMRPLLETKGTRPAS